MAIPEVDFDHHSEQYRKDPVGTLGSLRTQCPMAHTSRYGGQYVLTGHRLVSSVASNHRVFSSKHVPGDDRFPGVNVPGTNAVFAIGEYDPPDHTAARRVFNPFFTKSEAARRRPAVQRWATIALDTAIEAGHIDLVNDYANAVSALFACDLLSLPHSEWRAWAEPAHARASLRPGAPGYEEAGTAFAQMVVAIAERAKELRASPDDTLLSTVAQLRSDDGAYVEDAELRTICTTLIVGGFDTNSSLVANMLWHLAGRPDLRRRLVAEPQLIASAIEEYLRYFTPAQGLGRTVLEPVELEGCPLQPYDRVFLSWAAANRDPEQFDDPDRVVIDRAPNRHLAFGSGIHRCIGRHFARMVAEVVVMEFVSRIPDYTIDEAGSDRFPSVGIINGWVAMPATFPPGKPQQRERLP